MTGNESTPIPQPWEDFKATSETELTAIETAANEAATAGIDADQKAALLAKIDQLEKSLADRTEKTPELQQLKDELLGLRYIVSDLQAAEKTAEAPVEDDAATVEPTVEAGQTAQAEWDAFYNETVDQISALVEELIKPATIPTRLLEIQQAANQLSQQIAKRSLLPKNWSQLTDDEKENRRTQLTNLRDERDRLMAAIDKKLDNPRLGLNASDEKQKIDVATWSDADHPDEAKQFEQEYLAIKKMLDDDPNFDPRTPKNVIDELKRKIADFKEDMQDQTGFVVTSYQNPTQVRRHLESRYIEAGSALAGVKAEEVLKSLIERTVKLDEERDNKAYADALNTVPSLREVATEIENPVLPPVANIAEIDNRLKNLLEHQAELQKSVDDETKLKTDHGENTATRIISLASKIEARLKQLGALRVRHYADLAQANALPEFKDVHDLLTAYATGVDALTPQQKADFNAKIKSLTDYKLPPLVTAVGPAQPEATAFDAFEKKRQELIVEAQNELERLTLRQRALDRIEAAWKQMKASDSMTKNNPQNDIRLNAPLVGNNIDAAGILTLVDKFFPSERPKWDAMINIYNGFMASAKTDVFKQLAWYTAKESRKEAAKHVGFGDIRSFKEELEKRPETAGMFDRVERYFSAPYTYYVKKYNPGDDPTDPSFSGWRLVESTEPGATQITHNYGKDGNPNSDQEFNGVVTIDELLKYEFKDAPQSIRDTIQFCITIGELRLKYQRKYHGNYMKSADGTYDVKPIFTHSPMDAITYKIRANGKIFPQHSILWQIFRFPPKSGIFVTPAVDPKLNPVAYKEEAKLSLDQREHIPQEYDHARDKGKKHPDHASGNENIYKALDVRTLLDMGLSTHYHDFDPVVLDEDLTVLPYYWDVIFAKNDDGSLKYGGITYEEYTISLDAYDSFIELVGKPKKITKISDVNDAIGNVISKISPFKGLLNVVPTENPDGTPRMDGIRFRQMLVQILLRYTKNIYDQFEVGAKFGVMDIMRSSFLEGKLMTKRRAFLEIVISEFNNAGTLDSKLKGPIVHILEQHLESNAEIYFSNLFSTSKYDVTATANPFEGNRRAKLLEQFLKEPTEEEKKH